MKNRIQKFNQFFKPERRTAILVTAMALSFLVAVWWQARNYVENQLVRNAKSVVQDNLNSFGANIHQGILDKISLTESLSAYVYIDITYHGELDEESLVEYVARLYQSTGRIKNIAVAPGGVMGFVYPYEENKSVIGYEPAADQRIAVRAQVEMAIDTGEVTISQPVELIQGGLGLITRQAVFLEDGYWGLTNIVLDVPGLLDDAGVIDSGNIDLAIKDNNDAVFFGNASVFTRAPVTTEIPLPGGSWVIAGVPNQGWEQLYRGGIVTIDVMAYIIMLLVGWMTYNGILQQQILASQVEERTAALRKTEIELLEDIAKREEVEREKDRLLDSESHQRAIAETLTEITLALNSLIDIDSILDEILEQIHRLVPYETANITLIENSHLEIRAQRGYERYGADEFLKQFSGNLEDFPLDLRGGLQGKSVLIPDVTKDPDWISFEETNWIRSFLSVPIRHKQDVIGLIRLDGSEVGQFSESDVELLMPIANAAAIALENAALFEKAQNEINERIKAEQQVRTLNDQLEERVRQRTEQLENANRELEAFSYSISHDLRAPLRAVSGISEVFREEYKDILDDQAVEYLQRMAESSKKMSDLLEGLLTLTQLGRHEFHPEELIIQDLVSEVFEDLIQAVPEREIEFKVEGRDQVNADRRLINALLTNLVSNAIKFTRNETAAEIVFCSEQREDELVFMLQDNGIGLGDYESKMIFEPFQRLTQEEDYEGMGIGLAIAKRIVLRHKGEIWVEPANGKGACICFSLRQ